MAFDQIVRCSEGDDVCVQVNVAREFGNLAKWDYACETHPLLLSHEHSLDRVALWFRPSPGVHNVTVTVDTTTGHRFKRNAIIDCEPAPWLVRDCGFAG
jgi:hypothetical protein